jgi:AraC-like DNA-binding protein
MLVTPASFSIEPAAEIACAAQQAFPEVHPNQGPSDANSRLRVTWLPRMEELELERSVETIELLVPNGSGGFRTSYRTADGGLQRRVVRAPLLAIVPAGQAHTVCCERESDVIAINLDPAFFKAKAKEALGDDSVDLAERYTAMDPFIREIARAVRSDRLRDEPCHAYLASLADVLAVHIATRYCDRRLLSTGLGGLAPHKLLQVRTFIDEHLAESIPVEKLAACVHMSTYHFARMFKRATGQPPHIFITGRRMHRAEELLRSSNLALIEIATSLGFQTQGHFTGVFRKHTGTTPRVYRMSAREAVAAYATRSVTQKSRNPERFSRKVEETVLPVF